MFNWFSQLFGPGSCREHIESLILPEPTPGIVMELKCFRVLSGHVPIDYFAYFASGNFTALTIIRDPVEQFFSHINHIVTAEVSGGLLQKIRDKAAISTGYFLEHASAEELAYFENSQSRTILGGVFDWRSVNLNDRIDWLRRTYAAVITTETMQDELGWMRTSQMSAPPPFPKLNTKRYRRDPLTVSQKKMLTDLVQEDIILHQALRKIATNTYHSRSSPYGKIACPSRD